LFVLPSISVEFANVLNMTEKQAPQQACNMQHQKPIIIVVKKIYKPLFAASRKIFEKLQRILICLRNKNWLA
jgi:hypothetical protein